MNEWSEIEYFDETFDKRTKALIDFSDEYIGISDVLDIGCGMMFAKGYLKSKGIHNYSGLDYKKRDDNTIVCDLNKKEFYDHEYDLFLIAGCLEYVENPEWFFEQLKKCRKKILISYCTIELNSNLEQRRANAWKNDLCENDIVCGICKVGFKLSKKCIYREKTVFFEFVKENKV